MKKYSWIEEYCLEKVGAVHEFKMEWEADLFKVGGKFFVMLCVDKAGEAIVSVKCDPRDAEDLRREHEGVIVPGYYLNKSHWNSIYLESGVEKELVRKQIDKSYELIWGGLTGKVRRELGGEG